MNLDHTLQRDLDDLGVRFGWRRGPFQSWKVRGYTVSVSAATPKVYVIARGQIRKSAKTLDDLARLLGVRIPSPC